MENKYSFTHRRKCQRTDETFKDLKAPTVQSFETTSVILFVRIVYVFLSNTNWCIWTYMQKNTFKYVLDTYRIRPCSYVILTCQYRILTCQYHIRTVSIGQYLHVSAHILRNASLLLLPTSICSPALTCAPARGRCTFAWAQARCRCTFKFDALSLRQVRRAGSAGAGE